MTQISPNTARADTNRAVPKMAGRSPVDKNIALKYAILVAIAICAGLVSACIGDYRLSIRSVIGAILDGPRGMSLADTIVWSFRLPRIMGAALIGAILSLSGVAFQSLLRNVLADPYIMGVSAASSVGAEAVLLYGSDSLWLANLGVPVAAFVAGMAALALVYRIGMRAGRLNVTVLLLTGVVFGSFLGSVSALMLILGPPRDTAFILGRLMGSLQAATFAQDAALATALAAGGIILALIGREMNILAMGDVPALQLGVNVEALKRTLVVTGSLLAAATVAVAGSIGFVGFIVPHIARSVGRTPDHRRVIPMSMLIGMSLMTVADTIARAILPDGREIPVGLITAFLGAPFFLAIMKKTVARG